MSQPSNQTIVQRYMKAFPMAFDALGELRHPDYVEDWPQSGERIRGHESYVRIHEQYPGGLPESEVRRIVGSEDRWVTTPSFTLLRINGSGAILRLRDGKVAEVTHYFADPFEAPAWRAEWVERIR